MAKLTLAEKLTGTNEPANTLKPLKAGPLTALYDAGALRSISFHGVEAVRGIAFLCRNTSWGTYAPVISRLRIRQTPKAFSVTYAATCSDAQQTLRYDVSITGTAAGELAFKAVGHPETDFVTNRTGFVVLHPLEGVAGKPVAVLHTDGKREKTRFPKLISPGQPIFWIRSLAHEPTPGLKVELTLEGDAFEMEDHRNWMDASYKTYVHSLLDAWPYTHKTGESFTQAVTVSFKGKPKTGRSAGSGRAAVVSLGRSAGTMPLVASAVSMAQAKDAAALSARAQSLGLSHVVCTLDGREKDLAEAAGRFSRISADAAAPVTLELVLPARDKADDEMRALASAAAGAGLRPARVVVTQAHDLRSFQPNQDRPWGPSYAEMAAAARRHFPGVPVGGGMLSYFTELNRKPLPKGVFDFVTHSVCPIVHAADDVSVMETLESLPWIFASTRAMVGPMPYHLGPSGISARDNPYGPGLTPNPNRQRLCLSGADPRETGTFAAAWLLGLAAQCVRHRLASICLNALSGPTGVIHPDGSLAPAFHAVAGLARLAGRKALAVDVSKPSAVAALAAQTAAGKELWLANLTAETQAVTLKGDVPRNVHELSARSFASASSRADAMQAKGKPLRGRSLALPAYAVLRLADA